MNEHEAFVDAYLNWYEHGDHFDGTVFSVQEDMVIVYQPIDDEEELDKYIIHKDKVDPIKWTAFLEMIRKVTT